MRRPTMEPRQPPVDPKLWRRMNQFITESGGWVVSPPIPIEFATENQKGPSLKFKRGQ